MLDILTNNPNQNKAPNQIQRATLTWFVWFTALLGITGLLALTFIRKEPDVSTLVWLFYLLGAAAIIYQPRYGIYFIIFMALAGDSILTPSFPFMKNFSSSESLLYLNDALIVNPVELYIGLVLISWLGKGAMQRKLDFYTGPLFWPVVLFLGFAIMGLVQGISTGGDFNVALWEVRPIFYLVTIIIASSNLLKKREHVNNVMWFAMAGLFYEGVSGSLFFINELNGTLNINGDFSDHTAAIHMNTMFLFVTAVYLFKGSYTKRIILPFMVPPVLLTYFITQRRAAFLTLGIALALSTIILYRENRRAFFLIVPPMALIGLLYIGAFWNSTGALGGPVQALKSVVAEDQATAADQSSNHYRILENANLSYTIHQKPLTGVGFGQKFIVVYPMPDLSFFEWWQYFPHNSIMWIWLKMGVGGFASMLFLVGMSIMYGARVVMRVPNNDLGAIALTLSLYLIMHFTFAYADISWDGPSMIYIGLAIGIINSLEQIVSQPIKLPSKRWPWQPEPQPAPQLRPIQSQHAFEIIQPGAQSRVTPKQTKWSRNSVMTSTKIHKGKGS